MFDVDGRTRCPPVYARETMDMRSAIGTWVGLVLGGAAAGALVVLATVGTDDLALAIGALTLPIAFGLGFSAWRSLLGVWVVANLGRAALRAGGQEDRFRDEAVQAFGALRAKGLGALPFSWVFVPVAILVGLVGAVLLALVDDLARPLGPAVLAGVCVAYGILLRRLARSGRLPLPME
jgi:hypothetical protein